MAKKGLIVCSLDHFTASLENNFFNWVFIQPFYPFLYNWISVYDMDYVTCMFISHSVSFFYIMGTSQP